MQSVTELIGAEDTGMRNKKGSVIFIFGGETYYNAPDRCKTEDGKFYVETWIAKANAAKWKAQFVGKGFAKMQPVSEDYKDAVAQATELMRQSSILAQQALAILQNQTNAELDQATAKVMQTIARTR